MIRSLCTIQSEAKQKYTMKNVVSLSPSSNTGKTAVHILKQSPNSVGIDLYITLAPFVVKLLLSTSPIDI